MVLTDERRAFSLKERGETCIIFFDVKKSGKVEVLKLLTAFKKAKFLQLNDLLDGRLELHGINRSNRVVLERRARLLNRAFYPGRIVRSLLRRKVFEEKVQHALFPSRVSEEGDDFGSH